MTLENFLWVIQGTLKIMPLITNLCSLGPTYDWSRQVVLECFTGWLFCCNPKFPIMNVITNRNIIVYRGVNTKSLTISKPITLGKYCNTYAIYLWRWKSTWNRQMLPLVCQCKCLCYSHISGSTLINTA